MVTSALLGATGSTGSAIIRSLLAHPPADLTLKILVRSPSKLSALFPDLAATSAFRVEILEGTPDGDAAALRRCLAGADVIFGCIGSNLSTPGITLVEDTAKAIIAALQVLRDESSSSSSYHPPAVIQLRSATLNPAMGGWLEHLAASFAFHHVYADLARACGRFVEQAQGATPLLRYIFLDPPAIHDPEGTTPTGHKLIATGKQSKSLMYADLGAAFCEAAARREELANQEFGVTATGKVNETWPILRGYMVTGIRGRILGF